MMLVCSSVISFAEWMDILFYFLWPRNNQNRKQKLVTYNLIVVVSVGNLIRIYIINKYVYMYMYMYVCVTL